MSCSNCSGSVCNHVTERVSGVTHPGGGGGGVEGGYLVSILAEHVCP